MTEWTDDQIAAELQKDGLRIEDWFRCGGLACFKSAKERFAVAVLTDRDRRE